MPDRSPGPRAGVNVLVYALARIILAAVLTVAILLVGHLVGLRDFPVTIAIALALVVALPLGMWVFAPLRIRATASVAEVSERRRAERDQLQARLRGEPASDDE